MSQRTTAHPDKLANHTLLLLLLTLKWPQEGVPLASMFSSPSTGLS